MRIGLALLCLLMASCSNEGTRVRVWLSADDAALAGARSLTVRIQTAGRADQVDTFAVIPRPKWEFVVELTPRDDDASRRYTVVVEIQGGESVSRQRVISGYVAGARRELRLRFDAACAGTVCDGDTSCVEGACVPACASPTRPRAVERTVFESCELPDAGVDVGVSCEPGPDICVDGDVVRCVDGSTQVEDCAVACDAVAPMCRQVVPSNAGAALADEVSSRDLVIDAGQTWVVDTTEGADPIVRAFDSTGAEIAPDLTAVFLSPITPQEPPSDSVFVLGVRSLMVSEGAMLRGIGTRALLIRASQNVTVRGTISAASLEDELGAGGAAGGTAEGVYVLGAGPGPGDTGNRITGDFVFSAGGGASNGGMGGRGGDGIASDSGDIDQLGGEGGGVVGDPTITPLVGGSGGGPGSPRQRGAAGGNGGGALQITAGRTLQIAIGGIVDASGSGGHGGRENGTAGGGGGSGGSILLEAERVVLEGAIGANGGGGGSGHNGGTPASGAQGRAFDGAAPGGVNVSGGDGGAGNWVDASATDGADARDGGGGGGGAGRIRINDMASETSDFLARVSPNTPTTFTVGRVSTRVP